MMKIKFFLLLIGLVFSSVKLWAQTDIIVNRYRQFLIETMQFSEDVDQILASFNNKHQWDDINYLDTQRSNWQPWNHMKRVRTLALAWVNPESVYYQDESVWEVINDGLNHWLKERYKNSNWWHNQIGIPQEMRDVLFLLKENLSENQVEQALEVFAQHRVQGSGAGANLTWSADLGFHYGVLTNNLELMNKCRDLIVNEIRITTDEGIQPDYSFHQHGDRLQMFQYGAAFLKENVRLAWECRATSWAFPEEKVKILSDFVLKGWQWMARGIHTVPGTMDRSASRKGELRGPDLRPLIPYLCEIDPEKKDEFLALSERQKGGGIPLQGFRYFPYSDFAAFQTDRFSFFLKTISKRTLATESINNENLKGKLLNSGDAYLIRDGNEYFDLMPVWDWSLLPGITVFNDADHAERKDFVGSVSDGKSGLTVMDYQLEGNEGQVLRAKKFWACHGQTVVCLIAGLEAEHMDGNIRTSLDQCRWQGNVTVNEPGNILNEGDHPLDSVQWIQHAGFACIFPAPSPVTIHLKTKTGSWTSINKSETPEPVTEKVFNAVLEHAAPNKPQNEAYVLAAAETPEQAGAIAEKPSWQIIRNDASCQAVRFTDETAMISFFTPGSVVINNRKLQVDKACLVLISGQQLYASNPSGTQETLQVNYASLAQTIDLPAHGLTSNPVELK